MAQLSEIEKAEMTKAQGEGAAYLKHASELSKSIKDDKSYAEAAEYLVKIKKFRKWVKDFFKPAKQRLDQAKREVLSMENQLDDPASRSQGILEPAIGAYLEDLEAKRKAEEERINRELREKEEKRRLEAAVEAEQSGDKDAAEKILDAPVTAAAAVMPKTAPKVAGLTPQKRWFAEVTDKRAVLQAVLDGKIDMAAVDINMPYFNGLATRLKESFNYPGMVAKSKSTFSGR